MHCKVVLEVPQRTSDDRLHGQLGSPGPLMLVQVLLRRPVEAGLRPVRPVARLICLHGVLLGVASVLPEVVRVCVRVRRRCCALPANLACCTGLCIERRRQSREDSLCTVEQRLGVPIYMWLGCWTCGECGLPEDAMRDGCGRRSGGCARWLRCWLGVTGLVLLLVPVCSVQRTEVARGVRVCTASACGWLAVLPCGPSGSWQDSTLSLPSKRLTLSIRLCRRAGAYHALPDTRAITVACKPIKRLTAPLTTCRAQKLFVSRVVLYFFCPGKLLGSWAAHAQQNLLEHLLDLRDLLSEVRERVPELEELVCPALRLAAVGVNPGICMAVRVQCARTVLLLLELCERGRVLLDRALQPLDLRLECPDEL